MSRSKSRKIRNRLLIFLSILIGGFGFYAGLCYLDTAKTYPTYRSYGIKLPANYSIHGIDVSKHQGKIDWNRVMIMQSNGVKIQFIFVKATEGVSHKDSQFKRNFKELKKHNVLYGAYHYFHPTLDPKKQAQHFIREVELSKGNLPPVCDIEETNNLSSKKICANLRIFLLEIEKHYGSKPIIYTSAKFYQDYLSDEFDHYSLWIAHYAHEERFIKTHKKAWRFWQHSESGNVDGIKHSVDFNVYNGDIVSLKAFCVK